MKKIKRLASVLYDDFYPFHKLVTRDITMDVNEQLQCISKPEDLHKDSILLIWGGADISPSLYNKKVSKETGATAKPSNRDVIEWNCLSRAVELGVPIIGICRGAQMLCAAAGGFLIQHVEGHARYGTHDITTLDGDTYEVNSLHHQMMYPFGVDHELLAWSSNKLSDMHIDEDRNIDVEKEPEFVYFPKIKGFAAQWHPEMMQEDAKATDYLINVIKEKIESGTLLY
jgi:putative glutamine amidotransferase